MRLLLDTHIYLWWLENNPKLSESAIQQITNADEVYISSVSVWEVAIKIKLGKLNVDLNMLAAAIHENHFIELPVTFEHAVKIAQLPDLHRDPFDRMLLAQALTEPLRLLTADTKLKEYSDSVLLNANY